MGIPYHGESHGNTLPLLVVKGEIQQGIPYQGAPHEPSQMPHVLIFEQYLSIFVVMCQFYDT